ncbi:MAG TPA: flavin reductase family protein [Gemmatimonadaceae bacterium]|nr:flavin reductase family protein [Gemmatimonadaceae bacterium]
MLSPEIFRSALARFPTGVTIVTARDRAGGDHGMTVSAFCALSLAPPMVLLCVDRGARLHPLLPELTHLAVNVLAHDQEPLSRRFADLDVDRFDGVPFTRGGTGCAILEGTVAAYECAVRDRFPGGDHTIVTAEVLAVAVREGVPLIHHRGGYSRPER